MDITRHRHRRAVAKARLEQDRVLLLTSGMPWKALDPLLPLEGEDAVSHETGAADECLRELLARHALDRIAVDRLDDAQLLHRPLHPT